MLQLKLHPVDRQSQETRSMFLRNIFSGCMFFLCMIFKGRFPRINHRKQFIPRKSSKAVYERTAISNNAPCNGLLHSKNIPSKFVTAACDPLITDLHGGTWHPHVNHISLIEVP